jgi:hypothetical protein
MENVNLYLRQKPKQSTYLFRRLLAIFAFFLALGLLSVVLFPWSVARADGSGVRAPSSARSSAPPAIQQVPDPSTGVYLGCQELAPASDLPETGR